MVLPFSTDLPNSAALIHTAIGALRPPAREFRVAFLDESFTFVLRLLVDPLDGLIQLIGRHRPDTRSAAQLWVAGGRAFRKLTAGLHFLANLIHLLLQLRRAIEIRFRLRREERATSCPSLFRFFEGIEKPAFIGVRCVCGGDSLGKELLHLGLGPLRTDGQHELFFRQFVMLRRSRLLGTSPVNVAQIVPGIEVSGLNLQRSQEILFRLIQAILGIVRVANVTQQTGILRFLLLRSVIVSLRFLIAAFLVGQHSQAVMGFGM